MNFKVQAQDAAEAFEKLGRSLGYTDFASMCEDLNYTVREFRVATIQQQLKDYSDSRDHLDRQRDNIVTNAFKHLRRLGQR